MRGLYGIPTRMRKSEWYSIPGQFTARLLPDPDHDMPFFGTGTLSFQPDNSPIETALVPLQSSPKMGDNTYKIVSGGCGVDNFLPTRKWNSSLYMRKISPVDGEPYWNIVLASSQVCICQAIVDAAGEAYHAKLIQDLLPLATKIAWPDGIPNDEAPESLPTVEASVLDTELWYKLKEAFLQTFPLQADQVHPGLTLEEIGMDSLDAVILWSHFSEMLDLDIDEEVEPIEEILAPSRTLREIYDWLLALQQAAADDAT